MLVVVASAAFLGEHASIGQVATALVCRLSATIPSPIATLPITTPPAATPSPILRLRVSGLGSGGSGGRPASIAPLSSRGGLLTISGSALSLGTSTACLSLSGWSVTVVDHDSWPGALPAITWVPPSAGIERFHSAGSTGAPSRVTTRSGIRLSSGTLIVRYDNLDSSAWARRLAVVLSAALA